MFMKLKNQVFRSKNQVYHIWKKKKIYQMQIVKPGFSVEKPGLLIRNG